MSAPLNVGTHLCAQLQPTREPTILCGADSRAGSGHFPKHSPNFCGQIWAIQLTGVVTLRPLSVISCIINTVSPEPHQYRRPVEGSMRLSFKKQANMSLTSPISSLRTMVTRTLLTCSTRTPLSVTLWCLPSEKLHKQRYLGHSSTHHSSTAAPLLTFRDTNGHFLISTHSQCRCQETRRIH